MSNGLISGGIMYFSLFGVKDAWFGKSNMSFFDQGEVEQMLNRILGITLIYKTTKEGYDKTMKGDIKYWHIFRFVYKKP